jgi:hypothetical protein
MVISQKNNSVSCHCLTGDVVVFIPGSGKKKGGTPPGKTGTEKAGSLIGKCDPNFRKISAIMSFML